MVSFDSYEFTSFHDAIRTGFIDRYEITSAGFVGYSGKTECFASAFSLASVSDVAKIIDINHRVFMIRGDELAKRLLDMYPFLYGDGCYEYVYRKERPRYDMQSLAIRNLTLAQLEIIKENYSLYDEAYIKERLSKSAIQGLFDQDKLLGFVGEHDEGSMGMLEILPEYRRHGYGELLERYKIASLIDQNRLVYCNVYADNIQSQRLQDKLRLERTELNSWWIYNSNFKG